MKAFKLVAAVLFFGATVNSARPVAFPELAFQGLAFHRLALERLAFDGLPLGRSGLDSTPAASTAAAASPVAKTQDNPAAQPPAATTSTSTSAETSGAAPLRVMVGKSLLINTTERLKRVSVTDPSVADALVVTPTQVLVNGLAPGEVSLLIWDELERSRSFDLRVDVDITAACDVAHRNLI